MTERGIDIEAGIIAASGRKPGSGKVQTAIDGFLAVREWLEERGILDNPRRLAHLIGQCAHESAGFEHTIELLSYRSADLIKRTFGRGEAGRRRFPSLASAQPFVRSPKALANKVYANRNGNGEQASGDGWRYRGRGYIQLTGRTNYRTFGRRIGIDLERWPELARPAPAAWKIAAAYLATRKRAGLTALEWADEGNVGMVTRIVNGGKHGLADREARTARALAALKPTWPKGENR